MCSFSLVSFATHLFLAYRMYGVFAHSLVVFYSLVVMSLVDLGLQLAADVLIQRASSSFPPLS